MVNYVYYIFERIKFYKERPKLHMHSSFYSINSFPLLTTSFQTLQVWIEFLEVCIYTLLPSPNNIHSWCQKILTKNLTWNLFVDLGISCFLHKFNSKWMLRKFQKGMIMSFSLLHPGLCFLIVNCLHTYSACWWVIWMKM